MIEAHCQFILSPIAFTAFPWDYNACLTPNQQENTASPRGAGNVMITSLTTRLVYRADRRITRGSINALTRRGGEAQQS